MWNDDGRIYPLLTSNSIDILNIVGYLYCYKETESPLIYEFDNKLHTFVDEIKTPQLQYKPLGNVNKPIWYLRIEKKMPKYFKLALKTGIYKQQYFCTDTFREIKKDLINLYLQRCQNTI